MAISLGMGQQQRERPQEKKPYLDPKIPTGDQQIEIESVDDLLEELEQIKKKEQDRCCWPEE
jgi:hypothetical protein